MLGTAAAGVLLLSGSTPDGGGASAGPGRRQGR